MEHLRPRPAALLLLAPLLLTTSVRAGVDERTKLDFFEAKIRPVLAERCYECHSVRVAKPKGGLRLDAREGLRRGGISGPSVVPGKPDESPVLRAIAHADDVAPMPPKRPKLPESVVADFRRWIADGAVDPRENSDANPAAGSASETWWSLRPIVRTNPPTEFPASNPIDAYVLARLKSAGLPHNPPADRRALIRRLTVDLHGLPPTFEEIEAFVADDRPDAYDRLVDRLLASPRYGERQARRWMDLARFAETHGHDQDRVRPNAWPYRDYLIRSFNDDVPYARFVREQIAADAADPDRPALVPALGFLAAGPWDESSLRDIREDTLDRAVGRYLDRDDMLTTAMSTFVGLTVGCARCHDHKFDPIPQSDYYALQAVFSGVDRADRAYDADPALARRRADLNAKRGALGRRDRSAVEQLLTSETDERVRRWEAGASKPPVWTTLEPDSYVSSGGATLSKERDGSILSQGKTPSRETVEVKGSAASGPVTALRLEVLPDDRLPKRGPGRNPNGNLHLTEIEVFTGPDRKRASIRAALADHDQTDWGVAKAIDGDERTAWGIFPKVGEPHVAVFELKEDVGPGPIAVVLKQTYPTDHPIGRFRLSTTTAPRPARLSKLPDAVAAALATPAPGRTREQRIEIASYVVGLELDREIAELPPEKLVYAAAFDFKPDGSHKPAGEPRPVHILRRGDIRTPGKAAEPGALGCVPELPGAFRLAQGAPERLRRLALADWIVDPRNPLTWRVIVNREWRLHFGRGLVDTPSDFGRMGAAPSHPELLDRLAADFRDDGGSLKRLHRRIVTSDAYRRSSAHDPKAASIDADARLLWRRNRLRLDAETVHDAVLAASGGLDATMGGPSVQQFAMSPGVHVTPVVDYAKYGWNAPGAGRRSVYRFLFRTLPDPFMDALDAADASQPVAARNESLTPLQALALLNNRFIVHWSNVAGGLAAGRTPEEGTALLFERILGRRPDADESREWSALARSQGFAQAARLLFNTNEFLFVD